MPERRFRRPSKKVPWRHFKSSPQAFDIAVWGWIGAVNPTASQRQFGLTQPRCANVARFSPKATRRCFS